MNELAKNFNLIEAALWFAIAVILIAQSFRGERRFRRVLRLLSAAFFVFGVSDLIEANTGAWWQPIWLLLIKAACVVVFVHGFRVYHKIKKASDAKPKSVTSCEVSKSTPG